MTASQKQCPRCSTVAPLDATFCGQCGRQYRTQFTAAGAPSSGSASPPAFPPPNTTFAPRPPSVWMLRAAQGAVAALVCFGVLSYSGLFRQAGQSPAPVITAPAAPPSATPAAELNAEARKGLRQDPIETEARRVLERESRKLDLPPPPVSQDGKIHLRTGGTISQEEWNAASRKAQESPVLHPPLPPPF